MLSVEYEPIERRLRQAHKEGLLRSGYLGDQIAEAEKAQVISKAEARNMRNYHEKVMALLAVDDFAPEDLRRTLAALYGVQPDACLVTRGADDAIDLLIRTFVRPGEAVAIPTPGFTPYGYFARLGGGRVLELPMGEEFAFSAAGLVERLGGDILAGPALLSSAPVCLHVSGATPHSATPLMESTQHCWDDSGS